MSSEQRISANRVNCRYSTGPQTPKGKRRSSMNSVKHGLTARTDVAEMAGGRRLTIPGNHPYSYKSFRRRFLLELAPSTLMEEVLADRIIGASWRLKRIPKLETAIMKEMRDKEPSVPPALAELAIALDRRKAQPSSSVSSSPSSLLKPQVSSLALRLVGWTTPSTSPASPATNLPLSVPSSVA